MKKIIQNIKPSQALLLIALLGAGLTLGSFYLEHVEGALPCRMCWWQRYTHWAIWALGILGILLQRIISPVVILRLALMVVITSGAIGLYQGLGQVGIVVLPDICGGSTKALAEADKLLQLLTEGPSKVPNCADKGYTIFNLSLAWWNLILMALTTLVMSLWMAGKYNRTK